jgi:hypothetical protein
VEAIGKWNGSFVMLPDLEAIFSTFLAGQAGVPPRPSPRAAGPKATGPAMRLTIKLKLAAICGLLVVALGAVSAFGVWQLRAYNSEVTRMAEVLAPGQALLLNADRDAQQALVAQRGLLLLDPGSPSSRPRWRRPPRTSRRSASAWKPMPT